MLPEGFIYIDEVHPKIQCDARYSTELNFLGEIADGYHVNRIAMTKELAEALSKVQERVARDGFGLVLYDAYRPQKAVDHFTRWAKSPEDNEEAKKTFYPSIDKSKAFELGYIAERSAHSRGSTADLSLIESSKKLLPTSDVKKIPRELPDGREFVFLDDGTIDMGSHFDLLDRGSWHEDSLFSGEILERRIYLQKIMLESGFDDYRKEWWHYVLKNEPFPDEYFNFDVK
jgi:D-alanyl-D-alanine dipeptidase